MLPLDVPPSQADDMVEGKEVTPESHAHSMVEDILQKAIGELRSVALMHP